MALPNGRPSNQGSGNDQLKALVQQWVRDELAAASQGGVGLHIDGATGDLVADGNTFRSLNYAPGTAGWALDSAGDLDLHGNTTIGGNAAITGTLSLPAGIINNAALTSPVSVGQCSAVDIGYATTTTPTGVNMAITSIPVPTGYSQAIVMAVTTAAAFNTGPTYDYLYLSTGIAGVGARQSVGEAYTGNSIASVASSKSVLLTGLSGGSISVYAIVHSMTAAWTATASNRVNAEAIAIFLR